MQIELEQAKQKIEELSLDLELMKAEMAAKDMKLKKALEDKDKQIKSSSESHQLSRSYLANLKKEQ